MNILPKKRWHVRTRENIARVRKDEAKALEEQKAIEERIKLAERESRRSFLLKRSRSSANSASNFTTTPQQGSSQHVNLFEELEEGVAEQKETNKNHEQEAKEEKEKYEKQIGYLTYLGQDTNEASGKKSWYDVAPERSTERAEIALKSKLREDPLNEIRKHTARVDVSAKTKPSMGEKTREKFKRSESRSRQRESEDEAEETEKRRRIELMRTKRLKRENEERLRTEALLAKIRGDDKEQPKEVNGFRAKYNSQFNPYLAKQNYSK
ncbi:unnamed protein product [Phyllotreta striolata]|uniref:CBF1-interacting co-repressor CIR N-terminal domain-containing protein n=1 Tax=Phyllotreta striolata TaxID=444603 RepID=A0A9N9TMS3_PHYSR|nr:unnamed protein product [Phyllotreta striolata]